MSDGQGLTVPLAVSIILAGVFFGFGVHSCAAVFLWHSPPAPWSILGYAFGGCALLLLAWRWTKTRHQPEP